MGNNDKITTTKSNNANQTTTLRSIKQQCTGILCAVLALISMLVTPAFVLVPQSLGTLGEMGAPILMHIVFGKFAMGQFMDIASGSRSMQQIAEALEAAGGDESPFHIGAKINKKEAS